MSHIEVFIYYGQFLVCEANLDNPFNEWTRAHSNQGFAWRPESVAFATPDSGTVTVQVSIEETVHVPVEATRAIMVPCTVTERGLELVSVTETHALDIPPGRYGLVFAIQPAVPQDIYYLKFVPMDEPRAAILRADDELNPPAELLMVANPVSDPEG